MIGGDTMISDSPCGSSQLETCTQTIVLSGVAMPFDSGNLTSMGISPSSIMSNGVLDSNLCCSSSSCGYTGTIQSCELQSIMSCVTDGSNVVCIPLDEADDDNYAAVIVDNCVANTTTSAVLSSSSSSTSGYTPTTVSTQTTSSQDGPLVGGVVAGVVVILLLIAVIMFALRSAARRRNAVAHNGGDHFSGQGGTVAMASSASPFPNLPHMPAHPATHPYTQHISLASPIDGLLMYQPNPPIADRTNVMAKQTAAYEALASSSAHPTTTYPDIQPLPPGPNPTTFMSPANREQASVLSNIQGSYRTVYESNVGAERITELEAQIASLSQQQTIPVAGGSQMDGKGPPPAYRESL
jgi:hypothetical protein